MISNSDFDFLVGRWHVSNRRLKKRLQDCGEWEEFEATQNNVPLPAGIGNFDDFVADTWLPGFVGLSLRLFSPQTRLWSIYWLDNQTAGLDPDGHLRNPVVGKFENGVGIFEGADMQDGQPVLVRFTWCDISENGARWEQAMSADNGESWEMNWQMKFSRIPRL
jgi:hypothetical protein